MTEVNRFNEIYNYTFSEPVPKRRGFKRLINKYLNQLSRKLHMAYSLGLPPFLGIETTNLCNFKCPFCATGSGTSSRPQGMMAFGDFKKIVDEVGWALYKTGSFNLGEPLINKEIFRMVRYAHDQGITTLLDTNGFLLNEKAAKEMIASGLDEVRISFDAAWRRLTSASRLAETGKGF